MICQYDSGAATGCQPACLRDAEVHFTYRLMGTRPSKNITLALCRHHIGAMRGRVYPHPVTSVKNLTKEQT